MRLPRVPRPRLTYANVVSTLCLVALTGGGTAYAVVAKNQVTSASIKNGQVRTADLAGSAVTTKKVKNGSLKAVDFKAGQLPAGTSGVVDSAQAIGNTTPPGLVLAFIASPATVTVGAGQAVHVVSTASLGSSAVGGADELNLAICARPEGGSLSANESLSGITVPEDVRLPMTVSEVLVGLPAGTYDVGLCGSAGNANWNSNDVSLTSALVLQQ